MPGRGFDCPRREKHSSRAFSAVDPMSLYRQPALLAPLALAALLLPFGRLVEVPLGILSIAGVVLLSRRPTIDPFLLRTFLGAYGAFVLPMVLALPDAVAAEKSTLSTIGSLRYAASAYAMLALVASRPREQGQVLHGFGLVLAVLLFVWCLDGLWQFATGENVLGYGLGRGYVNGLFGEDDNIKLGISVALLMPIAVIHALRSWPFPATLALLLLCLALVALSGKRAAWITAAIELFALSAYYRYRGRLALGRALALGLAATLVLALSFLRSDWVQERSLVLADVLEQPDYATMNRATGERLPLWSTALRMGEDHWLNGVGPRGFPYAYGDYAGPGDRWAEPMGGTFGTRSSHAHQLLLDIFSETGVLGLAGYALLVGLLVRAWARAGEGARSRSLPYGAALIGMLFPVNTHPAWYSSWSALLLWLFIGLYLFALHEPPARRSGPSGASVSAVREGAR